MTKSISPQADRKSTVSETTPLLASAAEDPILPINEEQILTHESPEISSSQPRQTDDKPLPKLQIFLLCFARMIEPIAFFGIIPFINKMIKETGGLEEADVGWYSGLIESMFGLTQMLFMISWGRLADRIGRKPVLVTSLAGVAVATAVFGLSRTIWQMILVRCAAGVFAGTIVTVRTLVSENSTPRTQARAFSFFAFSGNLGILLGPLIGGVLQSPAQQYGGIFKKIQFFTDFPYALPTLTTGTVAAIAAISCGLFVKETLKRKVVGDNATPATMTIMEIIRAPGVRNVLFIYTHVMFLGLTYTAVTPLFWYTRPELGGYGFSPLQISAFLAGIGISQACWLLVAFPILQKKYGTGGVLRACYLIWPVFFFVCPFCNFLLRQGHTTAFWIIAPTFQFAGTGVSMAFTCVQLALNDISPSPTSLGTLNALALTLASAVRTVGPAAFTAIFAAGAHSQFLNGYLIWVVFMVIAVVGIVGMRYFPEQAEGKLKHDE